MELIAVFVSCLAAFLFICFIVSLIYLKRNKNENKSSRICVLGKANLLKEKIVELQKEAVSKSVFDFDLKFLMHSIDESHCKYVDAPYGTIMHAAELTRYESYLDSLIALNNYAQNVFDKSSALTVTMTMIDLQLKKIDTADCNSLNKEQEIVYSNAKSLYYTANGPMLNDKEKLLMAVSVYAKLLHFKMYEVGL